MRNLKKILALVLALVMVIGMMSVASAATPGTYYADDKNITKFDESIQILTALGIYEGNETGAFNPEAKITRAEVATLVYRIVTQDTAGKYAHIYSDYNQFADVSEDAWYAGYVNFCANGGYIVGDGTNFHPMTEVTGYQVLAIMLRVIGYGMEGEYQGTNWHIRTASKAAELGITKNIVAGTLGDTSSRAMVAELLYRSIAQTETVHYNRVTLYTPTSNTYAYTHFGLTGDISQKTNSLATVDGKFDEPASYWTWAGGLITIRYNPVGYYTDYVADETIYAAVNGRGAAVAVDYFNVDGVYQGAVSLIKDAKDETVEFGGKGVETLVFVADGQIFIVEKNTYVDYLAADKTGEALSWAYADGKVATGLANGAVVIYNMYQFDYIDPTSGTPTSILLADSTSVHAAPMKNLVVTHTYDTNEADTSYFTAGGTKYVYNSFYASNGYGWNVPQVILNRDELSFDVALWAETAAANEKDPSIPVVMYDKFDANQTVYFDDFGNVIHTFDTPVFATANEKGYVFVRSSSYGGKIADNRWVSAYDVIFPDGKATTIKGATNPNGYWTSQYDNDDVDYIFGLYAYEKVGNYYALYMVDNTDDSHIVDGLIDEIGNVTTDMVTGDADALTTTTALVDSNTVYIIANYDATGAISGYDVIKGFKNVPVLKGDKYVEYVIDVANPDVVGDETVELVLVLGAKKASQVAGVAKADPFFYLADTTPEDFVVTYDTHAVIANGQAGTMKFVPNLINDGVSVKHPTGFYEVKKTMDGLVSEINRLDTIELTNRAADVMEDAEGNLYTLADNCVFYLIDGTDVDTIEVADIEAGSVAYIAETNAYGYATVIYIVG